jgi:hypothetical protein
MGLITGDKACGTTSNSDFKKWLIAGIRQTGRKRRRCHYLPGMPNKVKEGTDLVY